MFEPTPTSPDSLLVNLSYEFGHNDQIGLHRGQMSDFKQCLNLLLVIFFVARKPIINGRAIRPTGILFCYLGPRGMYLHMHTHTS